MLRLHNLTFIKGFLPLGDAAMTEHFNEIYIALKLKEGTIFNDKELAALPDVPAFHPYSWEWSIRRHSCYKLFRYIKRHSNLCNILEVGCGNGWLSANMSKAAGVTVTGIDINLVELQQARKVFRKIRNLNL